MMKLGGKSMKEKQIKIGKGFFNWPSRERRSDRYGTVWLLAEDDETVLPFDKSIEGKKGKLIVKILGTRQSRHIGDFCRGFFPETPKQGETIELGFGIVFFDSSEWGSAIGLRPLENRKNDWLNPEKLYRCHDQVVELYFEEV